MAGLATAGGLALRWGRCFGDGDSRDCVAVQSHTYDDLLPSDPWISIPGSAPLHGIAHLLLAVAMVLIAGRGPKKQPDRSLWAVLVGSLVLVGPLNLLSGVTSATLPPNAPVAVLWNVPGPLVIAALAVLTAVGAVKDRITAVVVAVLAALALTMPWQESIAFGQLVGSYDTPPWTGSVRAGLLIVLGLVLVVAARRAQPEG